MNKYTGGEANAINTALNFVVEIVRQHLKEVERGNA
jgi:hypothetical protein